MQDGKSGDRLDRIVVRTCLVPLRRPLRTGSGEVARSALVLIDLTTSDGVAGRAYLSARSVWNLEPLAELVRGLFAIIRGHELRPLILAETLRRRMTISGTEGLAGMAAAGLDMAIWDAFARRLGLPLAEALGATRLPVPAYNSNGLGLMSARDAEIEAVELVKGFRAVKARVGRESAQADREALSAIRSALPEGTSMMIDFNQCLSVSEAVRRARVLEDLDLEWIEEPVAADDLSGLAVVRTSTATPVMAGENFDGLGMMARAIAGEAVDLVMPDVQRIGGVTGWLRASGLAEAADLPMSSHLFPEFSVHLLCATPTRHWLEYVDWATPLLRQPLEVVDGHVIPPASPGAGIEWDEEAISTYAA